MFRLRQPVTQPPPPPPSHTYQPPSLTWCPNPLLWITRVCFIIFFFGKVREGKLPSFQVPPRRGSRRSGTLKWRQERPRCPCARSTNPSHTASHLVHTRAEPSTKTSDVLKVRFECSRSDWRCFWWCAKRPKNFRSHRTQVRRIFESTNKSPTHKTQK